MKWIVYCTICTKNNKIYIGVHKTENPDIFDGYLGNGIKVGYTLQNPKTAFQYALKKYGYNSFIRTTLRIFDNIEEAYSFEKEIVDLNFIRRDDTYNIALGGINSGTVYDKLYQYDLNGNFIKEWNSFQEAIEFYGCNSNKFNMAITNKYNTFGSYWSKIKYDLLDISEHKISKFSTIYQFDMDGNLINKFDNTTTAYEFTKISKNSISESISKKIPVLSYFFTKDSSTIFNIIKQYLDNRIVSKYVYKYNKNKELVTSYISLTKAASENNIKYHTLKSSILNGCLTNDHYWSYNSTSVEYDKPKQKVAQYDLNGKLIKVWDTISQCKQEFPKVLDVIKKRRNHTHNFTFELIK